ncbi:MAG: phosphotransferase family protein [Acidimicrobiia bacterium]
MPAPSTSPEGLDLDALQTFFADNAPDAGDRPLHAELIAGGRSNLTYRVTDGERQWVVRRPPLGHVLPTAHDMSREHRMLDALAATDVPVPAVLALCTDEAVIGAPFYVMEHVDGRVLRTAADVGELDDRQAARVSRELVDVLVRIHAVDVDEVGLADFGRPEGYLERQVRRWGRQWESSKTRDLPALDELARRLSNAIPLSPAPTIVHGDYRLDNTMVDPTGLDRIVAVLDWEMATIGDPLADLGLLVLYWGEADAQVIATGQAMLERPGFLTTDEVVTRYASRSGRAVDSLDFYVALGAYKLAIIVEGIHARHRMGKTLGAGFDTVGDLVPSIADRALERASRSSLAALRG